MVPRIGVYSNGHWTYYEHVESIVAEHGHLGIFEASGNVSFINMAKGVKLLRLGDVDLGAR